MRHRVTTVSQHEDRILADVKRFFYDIYGDAGTAKREAQIAELPKVEWNGRTLYTLRCQGDYGKGPHDMNVPESLLWNLIDLGVFYCPFHR